MRGNVELWAYPVDGREPTKMTPQTWAWDPGWYRLSHLMPTDRLSYSGTNKLFFTAATPRQHGDAVVLTRRSCG